MKYDHSQGRKYQAIYGSNIDYQDTYGAAYNHPKVRFIYQTEKGLIRVEFKGLDETLALISPQGVIQIFYATLEELKRCLDLLRKILVPRSGEGLILEAQGNYALVDEIRRLIQEGVITHDMDLTLEELVRLTSWERGAIGDLLPTILQEDFPFGIKLKLSRVTAGCSRAEPYVEEWFKNVERALKAEGFYSPYSFDWQQGLFFELVKPLANGVLMRIKAFEDGRVIPEIEPRHLAWSTLEILERIFNMYGIPYEIDRCMGSRARAKVRAIDLAIFGAILLGIAYLGDK